MSTRRGPDGAKDEQLRGADSNPSPESPVLPKQAVITRRSLMFGGAALTLLSALGLQGDGRPDQPSPRQVPSTSTMPSVDIKPNIDIDIPGDASAEIPQFEITENQQPEFEVPAGLAMGKEEFMEFAKNFTPDVLNFANNDFAPVLAGAASNDRADRIGQFMGNIKGFLRGLDPRIAAALQSYDAAKRSQGIDPRITPYLFDLLNQYLAAGGYYFYYSEIGSDGVGDLQILPINGAANVRVKNAQGAEIMDVPAWHFGQSKFSGSLPNPRRPLGTGDIISDKIFVFDDTIGSNLPGLYDLMEKYRPGFKSTVTFDRFIEIVKDETYKHEATHLAMCRIFAKCGAFARSKGPSSPIGFGSPIPIKVGSKLYDLPGQHTLGEMQELCAFGAQIASTADKIPQLTVICLLTDEGLPPSYNLLRRVLLFAVLKAAPECPTKMEILGRINSGLVIIPAAELTSLLNDPAFSPDRFKQVGETLYRLGIKLFKEAEASL